MASRIDINCDMGESLGVYRLGNDEDTVRYITSANVACGFHASDPTVMEKTVELCRAHGVMVGAHPGYPDLLGFGRRSMDIPDRDLVNYVVYQVGALKGFLALAGMPLQHVKLHGALYHLMAADEGLFLKIVSSVRKAFGDVIFLTLASGKASELKVRLEAEGVRIALEAFPDRQYGDAGELLSRSGKASVLTDPGLIAERAMEMVRMRGVSSVSGQWIPMDIDTVCIHGDNTSSVEAARLLRARAEEGAVEVVPLSTFI